MFRKFCVLALGLSAFTHFSAVADEVKPEQQFRRGEFVHVVLRSGTEYHLKLTAICPEAVVGLSGNTSVRVQREQVALLEREAQSVATSSGGAHPESAAMAMLSLTAMTRSAAQHYGTGRACGQLGIGSHC